MSFGFGGIERGPLAVLVVAGGPVVAGLSTRTPWWVLVAAAGVVVTTMMMRFGTRTTVGWLLDWASYRIGREARARERTRRWELRDVRVASGVCGVHTDDTTLVAMIQLAPDLDLPTVIAEQTLYTEDTIGVGMLQPLLDQYGIAVDIDIVTTGQRVRPGGSYSMLYDQLLGSHPVVGNRMSWLVVRLDQERNLDVLRRRGPCEVVAPKALASATHRIATRLREQGVSAQPLPADAVGHAAQLLHGEVELSDLREKWDRLESSVAQRCVSSFLIDWTRLGATGLDDCWSWNRGRTTVVVSLAGDAAGVRGLVRYVGPPMAGPPVDYLLPLRGRQSTALLASLPTAISVRSLPVDGEGRNVAPDDLADELTMAIGPNGQILGSISGQPRHTLAMPLFDPSAYNPQRRTIDVRADLPVAQQIVLRAMVVGADVEVYSARPQQWAQLVAAVGDPSSLRLVPEQDDPLSGQAEPEQRSGATMAVFDQVPLRASAAPTTVTISDPTRPRQNPSDLSIDQVGASAVDVGIPMRTVRVDLIEPRGETRYLNYLNRDDDAVTDVPAIAPPVSAPEPGHGRVPRDDPSVVDEEIGWKEVGR